MFRSKGECDFTKMENVEDAKKLLMELGLLYPDSTALVQNRVRELNMRQLDRLKMMLGRVDRNKDVFSEKTREGVKQNDFSAFAVAVITLNTLLANEKHN